MSRSKRKTPIFGHTCCNSEKQDKRQWHKRFRHAAKQDENYGEGHSVKEYSDTWSMGKDGKHYWSDATDKFMRK